MHPVLDCELVTLRQRQLAAAAVHHADAARPALAGPVLPGRPSVGRPGRGRAGALSARWSADLATVLLRRRMTVAERRAARLDRDRARLGAAIADVEARARATRARLA
ncbi:hypothetical protein [Aquipuribacter hungaricus]|uniref:Uncharacterized protein n=1 Tax=Aquipuribacter hungaricus TaxID=545624 RepID=A0ABV7WGX5_9MICO